MARTALSRDMIGIYAEMLGLHAKSLQRAHDRMTEAELDEVLIHWTRFENRDLPNIQHFAQQVETEVNDSCVARQ